MQLQIGLEFAVCLRKRCFLSDLNIIRAVVSHDTAPERIVHIEIERLLILPVNRLNHVGQIEGKIGNRGNRHRILKHVPVIRV